MLYKKIYQSPLGPMSLVASEKGLRGAWFEGQKYFERGLEEEPVLADHVHLERARHLLDQYFAGQAVDLAQLQLDLIGTDFQQRVWACLLAIPAGQTTTYGHLARQLQVCSSQAVGGAVGRNPISILVPCHRVLNQKGQLTGYAGGLDKKIWLLQHENPELILNEN